jgi:hypothetical protein
MQRMAIKDPAADADEKAFIAANLLIDTPACLGCLRFDWRHCVIQFFSVLHT